MAGIMIMGPYVIRSWNAQVKGWEDSVVDSLQDPLIEAPSGSISVQGCDPQPWIDVGCAVGGLGWPDECGGPTFSCSAIEMLMRRPYNPDRCQCAPLFAVPISEYLKCEERTTCCTAWSPSSTENTTLVPPPLPTDCGANVGCPDGEVRQTRTCGAGGGPTARCFPDPVCNFNCYTPPTITDTTPLTGIEYTSLCNNDDQGLTNNTPYAYTQAGVCTAAKCEIPCAPGFFPNGDPSATSGIICGCPLNYHIENGICVPTFICVTTDWVNDWDNGAGIDCGTGYLAGERSYHWNKKEDRRYAYKCCYSGTAPGSLKFCDGPNQGDCTPVGWASSPPGTTCITTGWVNGFDNGVGINCGEGYLAGKRSYHNNHFEDRRFDYKCCYPTGKNPGSLTSCEGPNQGSCVPGGWEDLNPFPGTTCRLRLTPGLFDYGAGINCGEGYLVGEVSIHVNYYEDRKAIYKCCYSVGADPNTLTSCQGPDQGACTPVGW